MAIEIHLKRLDSTPWGFRLAGGADCDAPLTAIKVNECSIADRAGLKVGDVLIKINDADITGLAHLKAHDIILAAGQEFTISVVRGQLSEIQSALIANANDDENTTEENEDEECEKVPLPKHDLNLTDEEIQSILGIEIIPKVSEEIVNVEKEEENIEIPKKIIEPSETLKVIMEPETKTPEPKWSTFLQKPKGAPLKINEKPKSTYKVKIRTKKELEAEKAAKKAKLLEAQKLEAEQKERKIQMNGTKEEEQTEEDEEESLGHLSDGTPSVSFSNSDGITEETISISESGTEPTLSFTPTINSLEAKVDNVQATLNNLSILPQNLQGTLNKIASQLKKIIKIIKPSKNGNGKANEEEGCETSLDGISNLTDSENEEVSPDSEMSERTPSIEGTEKTLSFTDADCDKTDYEVSEMHELVEGQEEEDEALKEQQKTDKKEKVQHWNEIWPWTRVTNPVYRYSEVINQIRPTINTVN